MAYIGTNVFLGSALIGQTFLGDKQIEYTPFDNTPTPYVTSGSVLILDASSSFSYPGSGNTWYDLSGYGNNATLTNMAANWTGTGGGYFDFPNTYADYMIVTQSGSLNNAFVGDFTIDMWITADQFVSGQWMAPFGKLDNSSFTFIINKDTANPPKGSVRWYISGAEYNYTNRLSLVAGAWFNLQFVRTGTSIVMYQSTSNMGSVTVSGDLSNTNNLQLGRGWNSALYPMDGKMGWFAIYNRALSSTELAQNYNLIRTRYGV